MDDLNKQAVDVRDAFFDEIYALGKKDKNLIFITDDMDAFGLRKFKKDFPEQFINIGVAEQNMIDVAAGLASCGKKVYAYGICTYVTMRCFEQIKFSVCSMNLPVTIVGVGAGFSFSFDGPTHHGTQDVAIMRVLPEMTIYNLSDAGSAAMAARASYENSGPTYIRLDKGAFSQIYGESDDFSEGYKVIKPLCENNIVSTGFMTAQALGALAKIGDKASEFGLIDLARIKPLSQKMLDELLAVSKRIITIEENSIIGGLGSLLAEEIVSKGSKAILKRLAVRDRQFLSYGSREWFHRENGIDVESIMKELQ